LVATFVIASDWLSKYLIHQLYGGYATLIPGVIRFQMVYHEGGALDYFFAEPSISKLVWNGLTFACCGIILIWVARTQTLPRFGIAGLAMLWGALLANGLERMVRGKVTDFLETPFTPIINFADIWAIFATILIWFALFLQPSEPKLKES
jgi:lipoprotein signal peptidase